MGRRTCSGFSGKEKPLKTTMSEESHKKRTTYIYISTWTMLAVRKFCSEPLQLASRVSDRKTVSVSRHLPPRTATSTLATSLKELPERHLYRCQSANLAAASIRNRKQMVIGLFLASYENSTSKASTLVGVILIRLSLLLFSSHEHRYLRGNRELEENAPSFPLLPKKRSPLNVIPVWGKHFSTLEEFFSAGRKSVRLSASSMAAVVLPVSMERPRCRLRC